MKKRLKLPVGIDGFEKIRRNDFYYIDKTKLIGFLNFWVVFRKISYLFIHNIFKAKGGKNCFPSFFMVRY